MASLTIKDVPPLLLERLRRLAEVERRSLSQEILHLLEAATATTDRGGEARQQVERWAAIAARWTEGPDEDVAATVRARRTRGRRVHL